MKRILICYAAGCLGALANSLTVWFFGDSGITNALNVAIAPALTPGWLYPRIVWGGIWGFMFILPVLNSYPIRKGLLFSLFPTLIQLLVVFPIQARKGYMGFELGLFTPLFVVFFNMIWGIVTAIAVRSAK